MKTITLALTLTLYQVQMPANVVIVVAQICGLVDFESLNPVSNQKHLIAKGSQ